MTPSREPHAVLSGEDIIVLSLSDWEFPRRIRQYVTQELLRRGNRVLFVEAGYSLAKFVRRRDGERFLRWRRGIRNAEQNLFLLAAPPFIPGGEFSSIVSRFNWWMARIIIRRALRKLGFENPVLWVYAFNAASLVGAFNERLSLYLCNDAFAMLHSSRFLRNRVNAVESRLVRSVDTVITVSEKLTEEKKPIARHVGTIHHGVDVALFERILADSSQSPGDIAALPHPMIGYAGAIRYMLDMDLLESVMKARPQWSLVMVGPVVESDSTFHRAAERIRTLGNVHFVGARNAEEVPRYLNAFDVCILPYGRGELLSYYNVPLKFYEYLAAGKPVVWTLGPRSFPPHILQNAEGPEEFIAAVERALALTAPAQVADRKAVARENSWQRRVEEIVEIVNAAGRR